MSARDLPEHLARAAALFDGLTREFLAPPPILTVTEWAERHRIMSAKDSAEPGPYRVARTPYALEPQDALSATKQSKKSYSCGAPRPARPRLPTTGSAT